MEIEKSPLKQVTRIHPSYLNKMNGVIFESRWRHFLYLCPKKMKACARARRPRRQTYC
jgi:hypothetical protein